jgi:hypothetical protein
VNGSSVTEDMEPLFHRRSLRLKTPLIDNTVGNQNLSMAAEDKT